MGGEFNKVDQYLGRFSARELNTIGIQDSTAFASWAHFNIYSQQIADELKSDRNFLHARDDAHIPAAFLMSQQQENANKMKSFGFKAAWSLVVGVVFGAGAAFRFGAPALFTGLLGGLLLSNFFENRRNSFVEASPEYASVKTELAKLAKH